MTTAMSVSTLLKPRKISDEARLGVLSYSVVGAGVESSSDDDGAAKID